MAWNEFLSPYLQQWLKNQPITADPRDKSDRLTQAARMFPFQVLSGLDSMTRKGPGGFGSYLGGEMDKSLHYAFSPATGPAAPPKAPMAPAKPFASKSANPASYDPSSTAKPAEQPSPYHWVIPAGATVSSGYRTPEHNREVGGVPNSYHTKLDAFGRSLGNDITPPKGVSMSMLFSQVKAANPGAEVINEGDHVHIEPARGGAAAGPALSAFNSAASAVGLNQPIPQFNGQGYATADQLLQTAQTAQMRPFSATYQEQPLPELPKPDALQAPDYTAGDKAFEAAIPKNPFGATPKEQAKGQLKMRRMDYFAGMAQALNSIDWSRGVGLGELFAKLGAGALMGAKAGDAEVQDKMDKFDAAMQQYQIAVANRDDRKATEAANIANQNIQGMNQYKRDQWQVQVNEIQKHQPQVVDGVLITKTKMPDGSIQETHTPLDAARQTSALFARANNAIASANAANEYGWQVYRANREFAGAALPYAMADAAASGNLQGRDGIFAVGLSEATIAATETGQWETLYNKYLPNGTSRAADVRAEAQRIAGVQPGSNPNQQQMEAMNNYISSQLMADFVNSGKSWVLVGGPTVAPSTGKHYVKPPASEVSTSVATRREQERKTTRTTNAKGQVTTSERY